MTGTVFEAANAFSPAREICPHEPFDARFDSASLAPASRGTHHIVQQPSRRMVCNKTPTCSPSSRPLSPDWSSALVGFMQVSSLLDFPVLGGIFTGAAFQDVTCALIASSATLVVTCRLRLAFVAPTQPHSEGTAYRPSQRQGVCNEEARYGPITCLKSLYSGWFVPPMLCGASILSMS